MRLDRWTVVLPGVIAAGVLAAIAIRAEPPAAVVADRCITAAAVLLFFKTIVAVARLRDGGATREARLLTFVVFAAILMGWFGAERAIADAAFNYQVHAQKTALVAAARALSHEIHAFVEMRHRVAPSRPRPATWDADVGEWMRFESETVRLFERRFAARVRATHDFLTLRGMRDADLDAFFRSADSEFQMDIIAERLERLAERLERAP